jgi:hypothetical protein
MGGRHSYVFKSYQKVDLGTHYLSKELRILSPKDGEHFKDANQVIFEWEESPFARAYSIALVQAIEEPSYEGRFLIAFNVTSPISLADILSLPDSPGSGVSTDDVVTQPFAVVEHPLIPGDYGALIVAHEDVMTGRRPARGIASGMVGFAIAE